MTEARAEAEALANQEQELVQRLSRDKSRMGELGDLLPELEAAADEEARQAAAERAARHRLAERGTAVATLRRDLEVRATGIEERRALLGRRLAEVERRLAGNVVEREQAARHRAHLDAMAAAVGRLRMFVQARLTELEGALDKLRELRRVENESLRSATESLEALRRERASVERQLSITREQASRAELEEAQLRGRLEALTETVRRELDCEPASLGLVECPPLPPGTSAPNRARELERELRLMGPINPLALEEYAAVDERHRFQERQVHDMVAARRELAKVIKAVDAEIITRFKGAFDDVAENFTKLVATLFPGGQGSLSLSDPANILESGVELEVRPVGKNVKRLSLLSGGERSLVALAFLFAVFRSRPSPFYMMDEVESALDDVNLHRFLDLVHEFRDEAQLLIVSHQKRTMEAADCLYGVSMPPGGSSMVVSEKIERGAGRLRACLHPPPARRKPEWGLLGDRHDGAIALVPRPHCAEGRCRERQALATNPARAPLRPPGVGRLVTGAVAACWRAPTRKPISLAPSDSARRLEAVQMSPVQCDTTIVPVLGCQDARTSAHRPADPPGPTTLAPFPPPAPVCTLRRCFSRPNLPRRP